MDKSRRRGRQSAWETYRSALTLALSVVLAVTLSSWVFSAIAPQQAQAGEVKTLTEVLGVDRGELVSWLESHEGDDYYLGTPYKPYDWRSPRGDINKYGANSDGTSAGMNCTGFVWHAICAAHGWKDGIKDKVPALSGWGTLIEKENLETYTFESKQAMLSSGKLKKGDIIWMWADKDPHKVSDFHHVAIFWGDTSSEDLMWHSSGDASKGWLGENKISAIEGKSASVLYQVVKVKDSAGGFSVKKVSSNPEVTDGNDGYSLEGAVYGLFSTKADAETRKAGKAIKTYETDAEGKFTSAREFPPGAYYVAEIAPPQGYALDDTVYQVTIKDGKIAKTNGGEVKDNPLLGGIELTKRSANPAMTDGNGCYSLKGAAYGVFETREGAETHDLAQALGSYETGDDGSFETEREWAAGTYYVAETSPSPGYVLDATVYETVVEAGGVATVNADVGYAPETPKSNPVTLWAAKRDAETADAGAQGSATLAGALFEIAYYDGYYDLASLPPTATRTWNVKADADGKAYVRDDLKASGDDFYRLPDGRVTIPLGTVTVREAQPPRGYLLGNGADEAGGKHLVQIASEANEAEIGVYTAPDAADYVKRGGVRAGKVDRQSNQHLAQGAATLEGAVFEIVSDNDQQVMVGGTRYGKGEVVGSIETKVDGDGRIVAQTPDDFLPVGSYTLTESQASEGYLLDDASRKWRKTFEVNEDKQVVDLTDPKDCVGNQVMRGDFGFSKADGQTNERLGLIPFMVTSRTTGERHVIMTDENGMTSTSSIWNAHGNLTNANDAAAGESGEADGGFSVDEAKLDPSAGVWFSGRSDVSVDPDDALGALPYDTYDVSELRVSANAGFELASFTVRISRHARELDLGTVDDNAGPLIGTTLADGDGVKLAPAGSMAALVDTVRYDNLDMRQTYTLNGELHLVTAEETDGGVVAKSSVQLVPQAADGSVDVPFSVDASTLDGARLVAFEALSNADGEVIASHEDISDEGQTVRVPSIATTLVDGMDGDHGAVADEAITLVDTIAYRGLTPFATYTVNGTLHVRADDGTDAGPATDARGREITASQTFTPATSEGEATVTFAFASPDLAGQTVVAFEELVRNGRTYALHADIGDEGQTVRFAPPHIEEGQPATPTSKEKDEEADVKEEAANPAPAESAPEKDALPRTGDEMGIMAIALAVFAAAGVAVAALCIMRMRKSSGIEIGRGPDRSR